LAHFRALKGAFWNGTPGALGGGMDGVLFEMKKAHLAGARFGRQLLKPFGGKLTPARFNLMFAISERPMRQSDLWKLLGVVRSVVSEMLDSLHKLKWVKAIRAADGRTRLISLTRFGKRLIDIAHRQCILSGDMPLEVDRALEGRRGTEKAYRERYKGALIATKLTEYFGWCLVGADDLYLWDLTQIEDQFDWPVSETAHYELRVADPGMIDAPWFQAGDVLVEIES
jgi:DNA-binding MarR family transcriptional regulator